MSILSSLQLKVEDLVQSFDQIPKNRKTLLQRFADYIIKKKADTGPISLNFICTHNSRRSHLGQIWASTAAYYYGIAEVNTFSGGTEATAFNPRAVAALERIGFQIENPGGDNPHYKVSFSEEAPQLECFSKTFDNPFNPQRNFAAIMTCSDADENCPFIPGAEFRLPLTYDDPKSADGTAQEAATYDERVAQIGREVFFAFYLANKQLT